jgi:peptide/nickel transport system substrate-binding protein
VVRQQLRSPLERIRAGFALLAAVATLYGCSAANARRDPDTIVAVYPSDANTLNPLFANNEPAFLFYSFIFEGLTNAIGPDFRVVPWLAVGWKSTADHLHWQVALRRGVTWSDGAPFDSRDVVFTWKTMLDPKVGFPYAGQYTYIKDVVAEGRYAVRFDLSQPNVLFVSLALGSPILPVHILERVPPAQLRTSTFGQHPVGTGPYVLASWHHDDSVMFARNPHWWHGPINIPRLDFRIVLNNDARVEAMVDGSADIYTSIDPADYRTLLAVAPHLSYVHLPDLYSRFIFVNERVPGLGDLAVRQAMMYGWDRRAVVDGLYHGDVVLNNGIVAWALRDWHDNDVPQYPYDPQKARAMLDAAGWKVGAGGVRQRGNVRLSYAIVNSNGDALLADVCAAFQADMRAIGIAVSIRNLDYATFIDQTNDMNYQLALSGWGGATDPDEYTFFDSSQIVPVGNNETGYRNARVDRDLVEGLRTFDQKKRRALYNDMQLVTGETVPVLWGFDEKFGAAYSSRVQLDPKLVLPDYYVWWNVWDWKLAT